MKHIRPVELVINYEAGNAKVGEVIDHLNKIRLQSGYLVPYISGSEDIEALLLNPEIIPDNVPVEVCGAKSATILNKTITLEERLEAEGGISYLEFTKRNPLLMSFPPELLWLARNSGLEYWRKTLERFLPLSIGLNKRESKKITDILISAARKSRENYEFWKIISRTDYGDQRLSKILIELSISMAAKMRCRYMAGFNPIIDYRIKGSVILNHRINLAFATLVNEMLDVGIEAPHYFYTIPINSTLIQPDERITELNEIIRYCKSALETTDLFGGIHITIRNLELISKDPGRVRVVFKLFSEINQIGKDYRVPVWYSRAGLIGLAALDEGADFASYSPNLTLNDVFLEGGPPEKESQFGKIINIDKKELWNIKQLKKGMENNYTLPKFEKVSFRNIPDSIELDSASYYRRLFSKPYNIAAMTELSLRWRENIKDGEIKPGRHYLQDFQVPFNAWGL